MIIQLKVIDLYRNKTEKIPWENSVLLIEPLSGRPVTKMIGKPKIIKKMSVSWQNQIEQTKWAEVIMP